MGKVELVSERELTEVTVNYESGNWDGVIDFIKEKYAPNGERIRFWVKSAGPRLDVPNPDHILQTATFAVQDISGDNL